MADVQCGKFELVRRDPQSGNLKFRAKLTPAPSAYWTAVFHEFEASERGLGNLAVARIFKEDVIEFDVPEAGSKAAAEVIRRCVERTNPEASKRQAARQRLAARGGSHCEEPVAASAKDGVPRRARRPVGVDWNAATSKDRASHSRSDSCRRP